MSLVTTDRVLNVTFSEQLLIEEALIVMRCEYERRLATYQEPEFAHLADVRDSHARLISRLRLLVEKIAHGKVG